MPIAVRTEGRRGCGYRKQGGLYLVSSGAATACGRLPIELDICPCCGSGIKPTRGWTWIDPAKLAENAVCLRQKCEGCPMSEPNIAKIGKAGLLWIGEQFYATPEDFEDEARRMGVSRRIHSVPNDFVLGKTWVLLAHRKYETEIRAGNEVHKAAIFSIFKPSAIEYVVTGKESKEEIDRLEKRGITPVVVKRAKEEGELI